MEDIGTGGTADPVGETADPAESMEQFLDEDAKDDGNDKDHEGWRNKMLRNRTLMTVAVILLFIAIIGLIIGITARQSETIKSFSETTGHDFMLRAKIVVHPEYGGDLDPSGTVTLSFDTEDHFLLTTQVKGLEEACELCSVRVYSRQSCFDTTGPPFWNHHLVKNNPWDRVHYNSYDSVAHSAVSTYTGHEPQQMEGHIVVIDNSLGQHIACGVLEKDTAPRRVHTLYAEVANLPTYTMTQIAGIAKVQFFADDTFIFGFIFEGLPHLCSRCQLSIQEGTSCEAPLIGSHYFDQKQLERDPWVVARGAYYNADAQGNGQRSFFLYNGHGYSENKNHAVVLKAPDGTRIACGILGTKRIIPHLGQNVVQ